MKIQRTTAISFESWFFSAVLPYMAGASEASAKPSQAKPSQAKPSQAKPSQAKPSQV